MAVKTKLVSKKKHKNNAKEERINMMVASLVEHPASDHSQVLEHTQVAPFLWPGLNVQIACTENSQTSDKMWGS